MNGGAGTATSFPQPGFADLALSTLVAFNLAVAQPILDLTGRFPEFFLARRSPRADLFLLALVLAILAPALGIALIWLSGLVHRRLRTGLHMLALGGLLALLAIQLLKKIPGLRGASAPLLVVSAVIIGAAGLVIYYRRRDVQTFVRLAAILVLLVPALFLFSSKTSRLVLRTPGVAVASSAIRNPVPVVMLLLDELPIVSLMDSNHHIDAELFPGFARLASGSTWYRNATTVHDFTVIAVPAIQTGSYGDPRRIPIASAYPKSVFTLIGGGYDVRAVEPFTQVCPPTICRTTDRKAAAAFRPRWRSMVSDLRIIYEHLVAPRSFEDRLPPVDQTWANFGGGPGKPASAVGGAEDPKGDFRRFIGSIGPVTRSTFWFARVDLPHSPWRFLPSGQEYYQRPFTPGRVGEKWGDDAWLIAQLYQRHMLQLAAVDRMVNAFIDRLKQAGIYDRALILVSADHGISFTPGTYPRVARRETLGEVAAVPLFVKLPHQTDAKIDDRPVQTIDMVPTIADVLDVQGAYPMNGVSLLADGPPLTTRVLRSLRGHRIEFGVDGEEKYAALDRKLLLFGTSGGLERLYGIAPDGFGGLLGASTAGTRTAASGRVTIESLASYAGFDPASYIIRSMVTGTISGLTGDPRVLAISVGGRVVAVTRTFAARGQNRFQAMVAPESFVKGANDVAVFLVRGGPANPSLELLPNAG